MENARGPLPGRSPPEPGSDPDLTWSRLCLGLALSLLPLALACASESAPPAGESAQTEVGAPRYGGELIYAVASDRGSLFPGRQISEVAHDVWLYALERLVELNEDGSIRPWLAESWTHSEDGRRTTFTLRKGVRFHDGTPFDAEAVAFVFNEALEQEFHWIALLEGLERVAADDSTRVTFHFQTPFPALLANLTYGGMAMFSPTAYRGRGEDWLASNMVGTGPFKQDELVRGEHVRFVRNEDYWQEGLPYLDAVTVRFVPDVSARTAMLEAGEIDRTSTLNDFDLPRLQADPGIRVRISPEARQFYLVFNLTRPVLQDVRVRRAFNYAMDREGIVRSVFAGTGAVISKAPIIPEGMLGFTDMREPGEPTLFPYDPDRARALLAEAGFEDRDGDGIVEDVQGQPLSLTMISRRGYRKGDHAVALLAQSLLGEVGVDIRIEVLESAAFASATNLGPDRARYDVAMMTWGIPTADPDEPMMRLTYSRAWKPAGANRMFYASDEVDRLTILAHHEMDPDRRAEYVQLWMAELLEDAPFVVLPTLALNLATRSYVHGDELRIVGTYPARFAWIDPEEMARQGIPFDRAQRR